MLWPAPAPDSPQSIFNKGYQFFRNKQFALALPLLEQAQEKDEQSGVYKTFLAYCRYLLNRDATTREHVEKMLEEVIKQEDRQSLPDAHLFLAYVIKDDPRRYKEALRHMQIAQRLNPSNEDTEREIEMIKRLIAQRRELNAQKIQEREKAGRGIFKKFFQQVSAPGALSITC